jgi:hypothetical protein
MATTRCLHPSSTDPFDHSVIVTLKATDTPAPATSVSSSSDIDIVLVPSPPPYDQMSTTRSEEPAVDGEVTSTALDEVSEGYTTIQASLEAVKTLQALQQGTREDPAKESEIEEQVEDEIIAGPLDPALVPPVDTDNSIATSAEPHTLSRPVLADTDVEENAIQEPKDVNADSLVEASLQNETGESNSSTAVETHASPHSIPILFDSIPESLAPLTTAVTVTATTTTTAPTNVIFTEENVPHPLISPILQASPTADTTHHGSTSLVGSPIHHASLSHSSHHPNHISDEVISLIWEMYRWGREQVSPPAHRYCILLCIYILRRTCPFTSPDISMRLRPYERASGLYKH